MKATGIVRRIDELGRVVIPKEIRRTQRIRPSDPLEIYTTADGEVIFKKYSPVKQLTDSAVSYAAVLARSLGRGVLICDNDRTVAAAGAGHREWEGRHLTAAMERLVAQRRTYAYAGRGGEKLYPCEGCGQFLLLACPILTMGDVNGAVALLAAREDETPGEGMRQAVSIAAAFLAKQLE